MLATARQSRRTLSSFKEIIPTMCNAAKSYTRHICSTPSAESSKTRLTSVKKLSPSRAVRLGKYPTSIGHGPAIASNIKMFKRPYSLLKAPELPAIPELPPMSTVPYINEEEYQKFVKPLYKRGWKIDFLERFVTFDKDGEIIPYPFRAPYLHRQFLFFNHKLANDFWDELIKIAATKKDQPLLVFRTTHNPFEPEIKVFSTTEETIDPTRPGSSFENGGTPGITVLDARLAITLESLFTDQDGPAPSTISTRPLANVHDVHHAHYLSLQYEKQQEAARQKSKLKSSVELNPDIYVPPIPVSMDPRMTCTDSEVETYLMPLYARGWKFTFTRFIDKGEHVKAPVLVKLFAFTEFKVAASFVQQVIKLARVTKIRPYITLDHNTVSVRYMPPSRADGKISIKYIQFAIEVEEISNDFRPNMLQTSIQLKGRMTQPKSVEELLALNSMVTPQEKKNERITRTAHRMKQAVLFSDLIKKKSGARHK